MIWNRKDSKMEQSSLERTVHRIPASRSNVAGNKTRLHGRQRVAAYCRVSTDSEEQINRLPQVTFTVSRSAGTEKEENVANTAIAAAGEEITTGSTSPDGRPG